MEQPKPTINNRYGTLPALDDDLKRSKDPSAIACGKVRKRNGELEEISIGKVEIRLKKMSQGLHVDPIALARQVIDSVHDGITTREIDVLAASFAHEKITDHPDWDILASRIAVSNHHKETMTPFSEVMEVLFDAGQIHPEFMSVVRKHHEKLDKAIKYERDNLLTYFGFRTFEHSYGLTIAEKDPVTGKDVNRCYERPQHMIMRTALQLHLDDVDEAIETYEWMSCQYFTHASPTLMNAGKRNAQMSSCFLIAMKEEDSGHKDSIRGIYQTLQNVALISAASGGIGMHCSVVRAEGSPITSAGRPSSGIIPMLQPFEATANYVDQGRKRKGAVACFVKDTEIFTLNGGVKPIQHVQLGDMVVTHEGRVKPISQLHENPLGDRKIYMLLVERSKEIYVTGNHRFWSFTTKKYKDQGSLPEWNSIEELKKLIDTPPTQRHACYVSIPSGTGIGDECYPTIDVLDYRHLLEDETHTLRLEDDNQKVLRLTHYDENRFNSSNTVHRLWTFTEDVVNMFGIWLGDGHVKMDNVKGVARGIGFTVDKRNTAEIEFISRTCSDLFGCKISSHETKHNNCVTITVNSTLVGTIMQDIFGKYFDGKKLPDMAFSWSKKLVHSLLAGLITSDGHIGKYKLNATLGMSNKYLMNQLYHLCRANGIAVSFIKGMRGKGMTCDPFSMSIPLSEEILRQVRKRYDDDRIERCYQRLKDGCNAPKQFLKVLDIIETDRRDECVYTLGVEGDHSYAVEGLVAENCYLEPWHADIEDFLHIKDNTVESKEWKDSGKQRMRDLHLALWIPDLFMERVDRDEDWSLMCPFYSPDLQDLYGKEFEERYCWYESQGHPYVRRTVKARQIWTAIVDCQIHTGEPYMLYKDAVNRRNNQANIGTVKSSNLCVAGHTRILTKTGYVPIEGLVDQDVQVWNGFEWSNVTVKKTGENKALIKVSLSNGTEIDCTPEHRFYVNQKYYSISHEKAAGDENITKVVSAKSLLSGDKLIKFTLPPDVIHSNTEFPYAYTHGFFCGDGCSPNYDNGAQCSFAAKDERRYCDRHAHFRDVAYDVNTSFDQTIGNTGVLRCQAPINHMPHVSLYDEKKHLEPYLEGRNAYDNDRKRVVQLHPDIAEKFFVPHNYSKESKIRWLEGLFDADGTVARNGTNESLQLGSIHREFLRETMLMLQTIGVQSKVTLSKDQTQTMLPDGKGGQKLYTCKAMYRLLIGSNDLIALRNQGFAPKRLQFKHGNHVPNRNASQFVTVKNVTNLEGLHDTYCFTEHKRGLGTFQGVVTGQCSEIVQVSTSDKTAVCNLASISLKSFVQIPEKGVGVPTYDFETLAYVVKLVVRNLDRVIDVNYYPVPEAEKSNMSERPMGLGVQGLADAYILMRYPYDSEEAAQLNREIFETMYYAALDASCELAEEYGEPYPSYYANGGCPMARGKLQFDLWEEEGRPAVQLSDRWDWRALRKRIAQYGVRNSLLIALMPTASTSQLLGNYESFEPVTDNMYVRNVLSGSFKVVNRYMIMDLINAGLWTPELKNRIIAAAGSIQDMEDIPLELRELYKTSFDIKQRVMLDQAADRAPFIDQTASQNAHMSAPTLGAVTSYHMYGWKKGLKTGLYYLRSKPAKEAVQVSVDPRLLKKEQVQIEENADEAEPEKDEDVPVGWVCRKEEGCISCQ